MNYEAQKKLVRRTIARFPKFRAKLRKYVTYFNLEYDLKYYQIVIHGQVIADKVLLDLRDEI